jgi:hypothetical protein
MGLRRVAADAERAQWRPGKLSRISFVYIEPGSYDIYQKTNIFPEGTIFLKELQLTLPKENGDGSRTEPSGRGYFPGKFNGADVIVKDTKRYARTPAAGATTTSTTSSRKPRRRR